MRSEEEAIRRLVATWHEATEAGEVSRILPLMAEDVVFLVSGRPPMRGRQAFATGLTSLLEQNRLRSTSEIQEVQVSGDLAYCWSYLTVTVTPLAGGEPIRRTGHALSILRKRSEDGAWVVVRDANMLAAAPPPATP